MARAVEMSIDDEAGAVKAATSYWKSRERSGKGALVSLDVLFRRLAKHRDWNGLAHFLAGAKLHKQEAIVARMIYHVFGNDLVKAKGKVNHPSGVAFVIKWDGEFNLAGSNSYGVVRQAIADGKSWDDASLFKTLIKPATKVKTVDPARYAAECKRLAKMLDKLAQDGLLVGDILAGADKLREVRNAPALPGVAKKRVANGNVVEDVAF